MAVSNAVYSLGFVIQQFRQRRLISLLVKKIKSVALVSAQVHKALMNSYLLGLLYSFFLGQAKCANAALPALCYKRKVLWIH